VCGEPFRTKMNDLDLCLEVA